MTIQHLRRQALAQSLPPPTTLARAVGTLGFVQADPIRFPARAQDLILRRRVADYSGTWNAPFRGCGWKRISFMPTASCRGASRGCSTRATIPKAPMGASCRAASPPNCSR